MKEFLSSVKINENPPDEKKQRLSFFRPCHSKIVRDHHGCVAETHGQQRSGESSEQKKGATSGVLWLENVSREKLASGQQRSGASYVTGEGCIFSWLSLFFLLWELGQKLGKRSGINQAPAVQGWLFRSYYCLLSWTIARNNGLTSYKSDLQMQVAADCRPEFCFYTWSGHCPLVYSVSPYKGK